jgi:hypothetical protein
MFSVLQKTALGLKHGTVMAANMPSRLYISTQFTSTVCVMEPNDDFLRPCQWVLWSSTTRVALLVGPEEADLLIPLLRRSEADPPVCHLIVYTAPVTRHMLQFNGLHYYAIPRLRTSFKAPCWLKVELGIFAGRLYFEWDEYDTIMSYLGMQVSPEGNGEYLPSDKRQAFATRPLAFLHDWLAVRRRGMDFEHTPMGFITAGKPLSASHPFFSDSGSETNGGIKQVPTAGGARVVEDDGDDSEDDEDRAKEYLFSQTESDDEEAVVQEKKEDIAKREKYDGHGSWLLY